MAPETPRAIQNAQGGAGRLFAIQERKTFVSPARIGRPDKADIAQAVESGVRASKGARRLEVKDVPVQWDIYSKSNRYSVVKASYDEEPRVKCRRCTKVGPFGLIFPQTGDYLDRQTKKQLR